MMKMSCEGRLAFCLVGESTTPSGALCEYSPIATALAAEINRELGRGSETKLRRAHDSRGVRGRTTRYATATVNFR